MNKVRFIWYILTHQSADAVERMVTAWEEYVDGDIFILYGGPDEEYEKITLEAKCLVRNEDLLTRDHPRERQSYAVVFKRAVDSVDLKQYDYVYFTEFDQIPYSKGLDKKLSQEMEVRQLDLLCYGLKRIDKTNHPHWLNHKSQEQFRQLLGSVGMRKDEQIILSCYGFGQCWKARAFEAVASVSQEFPVYLEIWIPTLGYHLGYKVGAVVRDKEWNMPLGEFELSQVQRSRQEPWFVHPIKTLWTSPSAKSVE